MARGDRQGHGRHSEVMVVFPGLVLAMLVAALDQTVVATSLPSITSDLGGLTQLSWVVTAYVLAVSVSTPLYGKLGDIFGRKRLFQVALLIFLFGSMLCGTAQSMLMLVVFRALQGLGAGGIVVNTQAMVGDLVPPAERGRYQGVMQSVFALATVFGPLLGGVVAQGLGWRWVFYVNAPVCVLALVMVTARFTAPVRERRRPHIDWWGAALLSTGVTALILVTTLGGNAYRWLSVPVFGLAVAAVVLLAAFILVERRTVEPIVPLRLFRNEVIRVVTPLAFLVGFTTLGATVFVPLFQQTVDGVSPTMSGLRMAPLWFAWALSSSLSGRFITRTGKYRRLPITGTALLVLGMLTLSRLGIADTYAFQAIALAAIGLGLGMISSVMVLAAQNAADPKDLGVATSTTTFSRTIGGSIGVSVFGAIFAASLHQALPDGQQLDSLTVSARSAYLTDFESALHHVFLSGAGLAAVAFVMALHVRELALRRRRKGTEEPGTEPGDSMTFGAEEPATE